MPLVKIFLREGKNEEYVRSISNEIHAALVRLRISGRLNSEIKKPKFNRLWPWPRIGLLKNRFWARMRGAFPLFCPERNVLTFNPSD